ncbi:MAG: hypothetical protein U0X93_08785 [Anaerolineales bacterium]
MASESILRERRGKKYDLRPLIQSIEAVDDTIVMILAAREGATGRPEEVLDVLGIAFEETKIERTRLILKSRMNRSDDLSRHSRESLTDVTHFKVMRFP